MLFVVKYIVYQYVYVVHWNNTWVLSSGVGSFTIVDGNKVKGEDVGNKYVEMIEDIRHLLKTYIWWFFSNFRDIRRNCRSLYLNQGCSQHWALYSVWDNITRWWIKCFMKLFILAG
jgi:hypothetical protein